MIRIHEVGTRVGQSKFHIKRNMEGSSIEVPDAPHIEGQAVFNTSPKGKVVVDGLFCDNRAPRFDGCTFHPPFYFETNAVIGGQTTFEHPGRTAIGGSLSTYVNAYIPGELKVRWLPSGHDDQYNCDKFIIISGAQEKDLTILIDGNVNDLNTLKIEIFGPNVEDVRLNTQLVKVCNNSLRDGKRSLMITRCRR